ncbi:DUF2164 domain-containing protein [Clostridium malenominatum]|uniref:DUF2164 domain-containing protein n=1 Tax=Clostridium malenominatum TaxID=1539 RepID=A0ABN1J5V2_9CLOT
MDKIVLNKDKKKQMIEDIKEYFSNEREEEIGDLAASMVLDFVINKLAPEFYNKGVEDSYRYMSEKIEDMLGLEK